MELQNEIKKENNNIDKFLENKVGYSIEWCNTNNKRAFDMLSKDEKDEVNKMFFRIETIKKYMWSKYYYKNWEKVERVILSPFAKANYDAKKKLIIVSDASDFKKKSLDIINKLKKKMFIGSSIHQK